MSLRENLSFETTIRSDTAALHGLVAAMVSAVPSIRCLRDPTRGGLGTTLNEFARQSGVGMLIHEARIPVRSEVSAACEFLGLDPLYVANEGKLIAICPRAGRHGPARRDARSSAWDVMRPSSARSSPMRTASCRWRPASAVDASSTG